jgi:hypothetical protein
MSAQRDRVLRALQTAGPQGITAADFSGLHGTPDGDEPITRVAARILELKSAGFAIDTPKDRNGKPLKRDKCKVYVLRPTHEPLPLPTGDSEPVGLFAPPPVNAIYGDAA